MTTRLYLQVHNILGLRYRGKLRGFSTLKIRVQNQQNVHGKMDEKCRKLTIRPGWSIKKLFTRKWNDYVCGRPEDDVDGSVSARRLSAALARSSATDLASFVDADDVPDDDVGEEVKNEATMLKMTVMGVSKSQTKDMMLPLDGAKAPIDDEPLGMIMTVPVGTRPTSRSGASRDSWPWKSDQICH